MTTYGASQYRKNQATTATPAQLVTMLYDGLLAQLARAGRAANDARHDDEREAAQRAQAIVTELRCALNFDAGDLARNLDRIYEYVWWQLTRTIITKDTLTYKRCADLIGPLRSAWAEATTAAKAS